MATIASSLGGTMFSGASDNFVRIMTFIEHLPVAEDLSYKDAGKVP
jgi:hypothetical protein